MNTHSHYRPRDGVLAGVILALCLAFTDVSIAIVTRHPALGGLGAIVPPAGAVAVMVFLAWMIGWFGVLAPLGRLFGANRGAAAVSVAVFLGALFILADLNAYSPFPRNPYKFGLLLLISGFVATGAHFAYRAVADDGALRARYRTVVLALPLILGETSLFQWVHHFRVGSFTSGSAVGLALAWIATVIVTALAVHRFGHTRLVRGVLVAILVGLVSGSLAVLISPFVSVQRIAPTILELCGISYEAEHVVGSSLSEFWEGEGAMSTDVPYSTGVLYYENRESVIFDAMKYIRRVDKSTDELFNLNADSREHTSLATSLPVEVRRAQRLLDGARLNAERLREIYKLLGQESIELDEETIKRLKALGYM